MLRSLAIHAARIHHSRCIVTATVSSSRVWRGLSASSQWSSEQVGIERAFTIPGDWYTSRKHYEREIDAIFAPTRPASSSCDPYSSPATVAPLASVTRAAPSSTASWLPVGFSHQIQRPGQFLAGEVAGDAYIVMRGDDGELRAFANVCRHHAARLKPNGCGVVENGKLICPYHGWTYKLDGRLYQTTGMKGIEHFNHKEMGLFPLAGVAEFGPLVLLRLGQPMPPAHSSAYHRYTLETPEAADSSSSSSSSSSSESDSDDEESRLVRAFSAPGSPSKRWHELARRLEARHWNSLEYVTRRTYDIECNWKVFVDNYCDGGYHVQHLHAGLAAQLDLSNYRTELYDTYSIQSCGATADSSADTATSEASSASSSKSKKRNTKHPIAAANLAAASKSVDFPERLKGGALYAFVYPNLMINRYGAWLDTNIVLPLSPTRCRVYIDYFIEPDAVPLGKYQTKQEWVEASLAASDKVQQEDITICEDVQKNLGARSINFVGRYAPEFEGPAYQFHQLLAQHLRAHQVLQA